MKKAKVSVVRCLNYEENLLMKRIALSLDKFGGLKKFIRPGDRVLLKPNLLNIKPQAACVTTNTIFIKACAMLVKDIGAVPIVGDSPPIQSCTKVAKKSGLYEELKKIDVDVLDFKTPVRLKVSEESIFKDLYVAQEVLDADCVINLPKIKSHTQMTITACVKNIFGTVIGKEKSMWHLKAGISRECFAHMLLDLYYGIAPQLTIADMIMVMEGNGPSSGTPKHVGAIVTGSDCVAMDTVICNILNIPPALAYTLKEAKELHNAAPSTDIKNIDIVSDGFDEILNSAKGFKLPKKTEMDFGLPTPVRNIIRNQMTSKPVIDKKKCEYCKACEDICPVDAMEVSMDKVFIDYDKCIRCFCCQEICAYGALTIKEGTLLKIMGLFSK